jgi:hypothetical protein
MVVITVVLAAATLLILLPMMSSDVEPTEELLMLDQEAVTQMGPNDWDTSFTIISLQSDEKILWTTMSFVVLGTDGSMVTNATITRGDANADGYVTEGDSIIVKGMTSAYDMATLKVLLRGEVMGLSNIDFGSV